MQMHEAQELKEVYGVTDAQKALDEGWKLLAVFAAAINPSINGEAPAEARVYVLGRQKAKENKERPVINPEKMAELGRALG